MTDQPPTPPDTQSGAIVPPDPAGKSDASRTPYDLSRAARSGGFEDDIELGQEVARRLHAILKRRTDNGESLDAKDMRTEFFHDVADLWEGDPCGNSMWLAAVSSADQPPTRTEAQSSAPLALDQIEFDRFYRVPVTALGEDGDQGYLALTADRRRALAAVNAYRRRQGERRNYLDSETFGHVQLFDHCGCEPHEVDEDEGHMNCACPRKGLPPCREDTFLFGYETSAPDAVNALPSYRFEVFS
jgi:hypothetical protein